MVVMTADGLAGQTLWATTFEVMVIAPHLLFRQTAISNPGLTYCDGCGTVPHKWRDTSTAECPKIYATTRLSD